MKIIIDKALIDQALKALGEFEMAGLATLKTIDAIIALRQAKEQAAPPPECKTEAEKTAFGFGWWKALESQREQAQQVEPVAWMQKSTGVIRSDWSFDKTGYVPLYTFPPPRKPWVGLTEGEFSYGLQMASNTSWMKAAKWVEAKLKAKNGFPQTEKNT